MKKIDWLKTCKKIGKEVSKKVLAIYRTEKRKTEIGMGAGGDMTLEADEAAEKIAIKNLEKLNVSIALTTEERGEMKLGANKSPVYHVVLDPLDGSFNFKNGIDYFGISIAVLDDKHDFLAGYVRNILTGDEYYALKGKGSFKNGKKIKTSATETSHNTLFEVSPKAERGDFDFIVRGFLHSRHNRGLGAVAVDFGLVADGTFDALVYAGATRFLDVAAGVFIVREAGGVVTDFEGNEKIAEGTRLTAKNIIAAANKSVLESFLKQRFTPSQK